MIKARLSVTEENQCSLVITFHSLHYSKLLNHLKADSILQSSETHSQI